MPLVLYTIVETLCWDRYYISRRIDLLVGNLLLFIHTGATALTKSYFGVGFRHQFMRVTYCSGIESSLLSCSHTQLGSDPSCNALNGVGVRCIGMLSAKNNDINIMINFLNFACRPFKCRELYCWWYSIVWWHKQVPGHCGSMLLWSLGHCVWKKL